VIPLLLALAAAQAAPSPAVEARFKACADLARTAPERGLADAAAWQAKGGGLHARQCQGLAEAALERWPAAAATFEQAARDAQAASDPAAADFWAQSGNAWLAGAEPVKARAAFDSALGSTHLSSELRGEVHVDRARASVAMDDLPAARRDLDKAIELVPGDGFAWYLSAALARRQGDLKRAQDHIAKAVAMAPDDAEVLLEAGTIAGLSGEIEAAQGLYARATRAEPNSDAARRAAAALAANGGEKPRPPAN
jgi:tetratricopeptide (TPR) repeat protein